MNDKPPISEQELDDYLSGRAPESAWYAQAKSMQAPDALCSAVQQLARDALQNELKTGSGAGGAAGNTRWWPYAMAASVTLASVVGIYLWRADVPSEPTPLASAPKASPAEKLPTVETPDKTLIEETTLQQLAQQPVAAPSKDPAPGVKDDAPLVVAMPEKPASTNERPNVASGQRIRPDNNQVATNDVKKDPAVPAQLQELLQPASVSGSAALPPDEILRQWTIAQWLDQIRLVTQRKDPKQLAAYREAFGRIHPDQDLDKLLGK